MRKRVLIVDDSAYMRSMISNSLEPAGYEIVGSAADGESAIELALELEPDIITLDNVLPDMLGLDILRILKEEELKSDIIMISAVGQDKVIKEGMDLGAVDYIVKPFDNKILVEKINAISNS